MRLRTRAGVSLSDSEFHGIMAAVARRINRTANLGHPAAVVDQPAPPPALQGDWSSMFQPQEGALDAESTQGS